jgi:hypothetical protein
MSGKRTAPGPAASTPASDFLPASGYCGTTLLSAAGALNPQNLSAVTNLPAQTAWQYADLPDRLVDLSRGKVSAYLGSADVPQQCGTNFSD